MNVFAFDAKAALQQARKKSSPSYTSNSSYGSPAEVGKVGTIRAPDTKTIPVDQLHNLAAIAARVASLADPDGVARSPEAIDAVWDWAEEVARHYAASRKDIDE
ncbi:hypothetical protein HAT86_06920 [Roseovarius gahaiensis]|uniref:Uncharacterized protein n=1 Tax=Roseovarius gahaiensis TaxID=2716691 RepID=A0A967BDR1_9RHOB|nr:hypothetical protein [Roseovarius gahaiensis]NHQ74196.1 hypothetical protein [Roseovarius gahaiensis]